jgi:hypothetical protein
VQAQDHLAPETDDFAVDCVDTADQDTPLQGAECSVRRTLFYAMNEFCLRARPNRVMRMDAGTLDIIDIVAPAAYCTASVPQNAGNTAGN